MQLKPFTTLVLATLISPAAFAAESAPSNNQTMSVEAVASMLLSLLTVIALIFVLAWLFKRFNVGATGNSVIKVLASVPLGRSERLMLVEVGGEQLLLGVTSQGISLLHRLDSPLELDTLHSGIELGGFAGKLDQLIKRTKNDN